MIICLMSVLLNRAFVTMLLVPGMVIDPEQELTVYLVSECLNLPNPQGAHDQERQKGLSVFTMPYDRCCRE